MVMLLSKLGTSWESTVRKVSLGSIFFDMHLLVFEDGGAQSWVSSRRYEVTAHLPHAIIEVIAAVCELGHF